MQARLADTTELADHELSYSQSNFYAGIFSLGIQIHPSFESTTLSAFEERTLVDYYKSRGFTYVDDDGIKCGFSITYLRDDSDLSIHVAERPRPFTIAIIKDVTRPPQERDVTYITHNSFVSAPTPGAEAATAAIRSDLESGDVMNEVQRALNSTAIIQLIPGIIKGDNIELEPFNELDARLVVNQNLDDRDPKMTQLFDLFVMCTQLDADPTQSEEKTSLMQKLMDIINEAYQDIDYFKNKSLKDVEEIVAHYQRKPLISTLPPLKNIELVKQSLMDVVNGYQNASAAINAQLNRDLEDYATRNGFSDAEKMQAKLQQSFLQRNAGNILLAGAFLLAVAGIAFIVSGFLSPIGLTIAAGLATSLAVSAAVISALAAAERLSSIVSNERALQVNQTEVVSMKSIAGAQQHLLFKQALLTAKGGLDVENPNEVDDEPRASPVAQPKKTSRLVVNTASSLHYK